MELLTPGERSRPLEETVGASLDQRLGRERPVVPVEQISSSAEEVMGSMRRRWRACGE